MNETNLPRPDLVVGHKGPVGLVLALLTRDKSHPIIKWILHELRCRYAVHLGHYILI